MLYVGVPQQKMKVCSLIKEILDWECSETVFGPKGYLLLASIRGHSGLIASLKSPIIPSGRAKIGLPKY